MALVSTLVVPGRVDARSAAEDCFGRTPTITGTGGADTLKGTDGNDVIAGLGGNDKIEGGLGTDRICGGPGDDVLNSGANADKLDGDEGSDTFLHTGGGNLQVVLTSPGFVFENSSPTDRLTSVENLTSTTGGYDYVIGGPANNEVHLGAGYDRYYYWSGDGGADTIDGGPDGDALYMWRSTGGVNVNLDAGTMSGPGGSDLIENFEAVTGSFYADEITGTQGENEILGALLSLSAYGDDKIYGLGARDLIYGTRGNNTLDGGEGFNTIEDGPFGSDTIIGGSDIDYIRAQNTGYPPAGGPFEYHPGEMGSDVIDSGGGNDNIQGSSGPDQISAGAGDDDAGGGGGNDTVDGGPGNDRLTGGSGSDTCLNYEFVDQQAWAYGCATSEGPDNETGDSPLNVPVADISVTVLSTPKPDDTQRYFEFRVGNDGTSGTTVMLVATLDATIAKGEMVGAPAGTFCGGIQGLLDLTFLKDVGQCQFELAAGQSQVVRFYTEGTVFGPDQGVAAAYEIRTFDNDLDPNPANNVVTYGSDVQPDTSPKVELIGLEVTQGIQNFKADVPLIRAKNTYVRAHVRSTSGTVPNVAAVLTGKWIDNNEVPAGSPLEPLNGQGGRLDIRANPDRANIDHSYFFELPFRWIDRPESIEIRFEGVDEQFACKDLGADCKITVTYDDPSDPKITFFGLMYKYKGKKIVPSEKTIQRAAAQLEAALPIRHLSWDWESNFYWDPLTLGAGAPIDPLDYKVTLQKLQVVKAFSGCIAALGCTQYYVGILEHSQSSPPSSEGAGGAGAAFAYMSSKADDVTLAHELAHATGRGHTVCPAHPDVYQPDPNYPYPKGKLSGAKEGDGAFWGLDPNTFDRPRPRVMSPYKTSDLMSYCDPSWASDYTWKAVREGFIARFGTQPLRAAQQTPTPGPSFLVSGSTSHDGTAELSPVYTIESPSSSGSTGAFEIRTETATGTDIATHRFDAIEDHGGSVFAELVPFDPTVARIVLLENGVILDKLEASPSPPTVAILTPNGGTLPATGAFELTWEAADLDGDELRYTIQYSADGGTTWETLALDYPETTFPLDTSLLEASSDGRLKVFATDGFNSSEDTTDLPLTIADHAPMVSIQSPRSYSFALADQTINLEGSAFDVEDLLLPDGSLEWSSDIDGDLGTGRDLQAAAGSLSAGTHRITLTGIDGEGNSSSDSVLMQVFDSFSKGLVCKKSTATAAGTPGADEIPGTVGSDVVVGLGGDDEIAAVAGADKVCGGDGNDRLDGGGSKDAVLGGAGNDLLVGGPGRDVCVGGPGKDRFKACEVRKQ